MLALYAANANSGARGQGDGAFREMVGSTFVPELEAPAGAAHEPAATAAMASRPDKSVQRWLFRDANLVIVVSGMISGFLSVRLGWMATIGPRGCPNRWTRP
ncbi:MAG TPA: hypothetical protein VK425_09715 [Acidimicrobiales bacterium]|nr:hypothetical protein [Acidimicrobiales bacterium]